MGSQSVQGQLWGKSSKEWAAIQEQTGMPGYTYALNFLKLTPNIKVLDVGCGSGLFSSMAAKAGADVTGIDASEALIAEAKLRDPAVKFMTGEMEELPFAADTFDVVCGFNSFQYAASTENALTEAKRVLRDGGKLAVMIWGNRGDCEAATYLKAIGSIMPPSPPGAAGPFALSENQLLERILKEVGFKIISQADIDAVWDYPDTETALKGLMAVGPVARAIESNGFQKVYDTVLAAVQPYIKSNGHVVYNNKFRIVISGK
jgi:ubiquinone/menaquinone biosynthesis C-methylase UbiE